MDLALGSLASGLWWIVCIHNPLVCGLLLFVGMSLALYYGGILPWRWICDTVRILEDKKDERDAMHSAMFEETGTFQSK